MECGHSSRQWVRSASSNPPSSDRYDIMRDLLSVDRELPRIAPAIGSATDDSQAFIEGQQIHAVADSFLCLDIRNRMRGLRPLALPELRLLDRVDEFGRVRSVAGCPVLPNFIQAYAVIQAFEWPHATGSIGTCACT